jgi:hypothetical protein
LDYYKPSCDAGANCECVGCGISKLQSSSILSTGSSNPTIPSRITFNEKSIIKTASVNSNESLQNFDSTQNSPQMSILNNSSQHSIYNNSTNSPRTSIYNNSTNSPRTSIHNNSTNSPRTSIHNTQPQYNNSPRTSVQSQYNNSSRTSIYNIQSNNNSPRTSVHNSSPRSNAVGLTPIFRQIDKLKKESNAISFFTTLSSISINNTAASINSQSQSSPALSIKSDSSSMYVQPPSINSYIPIELRSLHLKYSELPAYIDDFDDEKYYYYVTKSHGVRQRKLKKPSSWLKPKYFKVNWDEYLNS